jgi:hypothetical protein
MTESVSHSKSNKRQPRRPNYRSILKAAKEVGATSVSVDGIVVRPTDAPPTAPNNDTDDIKSLL